jgi:hypothetical protein
MLWRFGALAFVSLYLSGLVRSLFVDNLLLLQWIVFEELLNQVNVCEHHSPTAVSLELESVEGVTFGHVVVLEVREIRLPLVTDDLAAREASDRNDHCWLLLVACCVLPPEKGPPSLLPGSFYFLRLLFVFADIKTKSNLKNFLAATNLNFSRRLTTGGTYWGRCSRLQSIQRGLHRAQHTTDTLHGYL